MLYIQNDSAIGGYGEMGEQLHRNPFQFCVGVKETANETKGEYNSYPAWLRICFSWQQGVATDYAKAKKRSVLRSHTKMRQWGAQGNAYHCGVTISLQMTQSRYERLPTRPLAVAISA